MGHLLLFDFHLPFLAAVTNDERERRRSAELNEKRFRADGDEIRRRTGRRHQRRRDDGNEFDFLFKFLLQSEKSKSTFSVAVVIVLRFYFVFFRRMNHRSWSNGNPSISVRVLDRFTWFSSRKRNNFRHGRRFDTDCHPLKMWWFCGIIKNPIENLSYLKVLLGERASSMESISSSKLKTMGSSTHMPRRNRQGPVTLTSWAQSPTVDDVTNAVTVDVCVTVEKLTNGLFFFMKTWSGNLLKKRSSWSVPLMTVDSIPSNSNELASSSSLSSAGLPTRRSRPTRLLLIELWIVVVVVVVVVDFDRLGLPQAQKDGPMHIRDRNNKMLDFILFWLFSCVGCFY